MRDHDLELIAALAEGRLDDDAEARALVDSSPELRAEYEAQRTAYLALESVGSARLTDAERAGLRRDIWSELRAGEAAPAPVGTPWYYRWVPALAGMFVVIGLVAVLNQGGDDSSGTEMAQLSATTQAATSDAGAAGSETTMAAAESADAGADETGSDGGEAMEETDETQPTPAESRSLTPAATEFYSAEAEMVRSGALGEDTGDDGDAEVTSDTEDCLREADLSGYVPLSVQIAPLQTGTLDLESIQVPTRSDPVIVAVPEGADLASAVIAFVDRLDCDLIYLDR